MFIQVDLIFESFIFKKFLPKLQLPSITSCLTSSEATYLFLSRRQKMSISLLINNLYAFFMMCEILKWFADTKGDNTFQHFY